MADNNFPCKCGHSFEVHSTKDEYCFACFENSLDDIWRNTFPEVETRWVHSYIPDNLKYLEEKYNQQILDKYRSLSQGDLS